MTKPTFALEPAVVVSIDCATGDDIVKRFLRFCVAEEIWCLGGGSLGPLGLFQAYPAADAVAIKAWLLENGIKNVGA